MTQVAVYGSLRQGMGNHGLLNGQTYVGTTVTDKPYAMYSLGGFPKVVLGEAVCPITVEIYEVDDRGLARLDQLEGFRGEGKDNFYDRSLIPTGLGDALIYHIEDGYGSDHNDRPVESGDWVAYRTLNNRY